MVNVTIDDETVIFEIKNKGNRDLKDFYTIDYFEFLHFNPEIYIHDTKSWEDDINNKILVPFRHFTNFVKDARISIKKIKLPPIQHHPVFFSHDKLKKEKSVVTMDSKLNLIPLKKKELHYQDEIITLKIKLGEKVKLQTLVEISDENRRIYKDDIEMNVDGLFYQDIENILKIQHYIGMDVFYNEVYRINGQYIIIKDYEIQEQKSFRTIDTSKMKDTLITKLYTK